MPTTALDTTPRSFPFGVASGDPTSDSIVLWTMLSSVSNTSATWSVWDESGTVSSGQSSADANQSLKVEVGGLIPGHRYDFEFRTADGDHSAGSFRTVPTDGPVRLAIASCAKYNAGHFAAYRHIANRDDIDFVLHLGDYIYEAANRPPASQTPGMDIGREFEPDHECWTFEDYDLRYRQYRSDPDSRALSIDHMRCGQLSTITNSPTIARRTEHWSMTTASMAPGATAVRRLWQPGSNGCPRSAPRPIQRPPSGPKLTVAARYKW